MAAEMQSKTQQGALFPALAWRVLLLAALLRVPEPSLAQKAVEPPPRASARSATYPITPLRKIHTVLPPQMPTYTYPPFVQVASSNGWTLYHRDANHSNDFTTVGSETWLATGMGIKRINPLLKRVRHYTQADGLPDGQIYAIAGDSQEVWCLSAIYHKRTKTNPRARMGYTACRLDRKTDRWQVLREWEYLPYMGVHPPPFLYRVAVTPQAVAFLSGETPLYAPAVAHLYDRLRKQWQEISWPSEVPSKNNYGRYPLITFFHLDARFLWIGCYAGLWRYHLAERRWERLLPEYARVYCGYQEGDIFWLMATQPTSRNFAERTQLFRYHSHTGKIENIKIASQEPDNSPNRPLFPQYATALMPDGEGKVWMAGGMGVTSTPWLLCFDLKTRRYSPLYKDTAQGWGGGQRYIDPNVWETMPPKALSAVLLSRFPVPTEVVARRLPGWICEGRGIPSEVISRWNRQDVLHDPDRYQKEGIVWKPIPNLWSGAYGIGGALQGVNSALEDGGLARIVAGKSERFLLPERTIPLRPLIRQLTIHNNWVYAKTTEAEYSSPLSAIQWRRTPLPLRPDLQQNLPSILPEAPEEEIKKQFPKDPPLRPEAVTEELIWYLHQEYAPDKTYRARLIAWDSSEQRWRAELTLPGMERKVSLLAENEHVYLLTHAVDMQTTKSENGLYLLELRTDRWQQIAPFPTVAPLSHSQFSLLWSRYGRLWATDDGSLLWEWDTEARTWRSHSAPTRVEKYRTAIAETAQGDHLYVGSDTGVWRFHIPTHIWEALPLPFPARRLRLNWPVSDGHAVWALATGSILVRYEPVRDRWTFWDESKGIPSESRNTRRRPAFPNRESEIPRLLVAGGRLWLTAFGGFYQLTPTEDRWEPLPEPMPLGENRVRITGHTSGDAKALWYTFEDSPAPEARLKNPNAESKRTLARYDLQRKIWEIIPLPALSGNWHTMLSEPNALWITNEGTLWRLDKPSRKWTEFPLRDTFSLRPYVYWNRMFRVGKSLWLVNRECLISYTAPAARTNALSSRPPKPKTNTRTPFVKTGAAYRGKRSFREQGIAPRTAK
jgi:hypothetical protein